MKTNKASEVGSDENFLNFSLTDKARLYVSFQFLFAYWWEVILRKTLIDFSRYKKLYLLPYWKIYHHEIFERKKINFNDGKGDMACGS